MAKRRRFSRWRRLPGAYRIGDDKPADPHLEPQRLTLYLPGVVLDRAELQSVRLGFQDAQEYCADLLVRAIEAEHLKEHVAGVEARRGALEGFHEIAEDAEYLAELSAATAGRDHPGVPASAPVPPPLDESNTTAVPIPLRFEPPDEPPERVFPEPVDIPFAPAAEAPPGPALVELVTAPGPSTAPGPPAAPSPAAEAVLRHAGQAGDHPYGFLACLRRGEPVPAEGVEELARALQDLEREYRGTSVMDRRLTFALHRLAFESQILQTDAWPGAFDVWTVDMVRAVQEAVERILSGQDIRYYPAAPGDESPTPPALPETLL